MKGLSQSFSLPPQWQARIDRYVTVEHVLWLLTVVLFLVAWNRGLHLLYAMFSFLFSALLLSYAGAWWQLRKLHVRIALVQEAHVGKEVAVQVFMRAPSTRYLLTVSLQDEQNVLECVSEALFETCNGRSQQAMHLAFSKRGLHRFCAVKVTSCFPFGLVKRSKLIAIDPVECIVYPRIWPLRQLPVQHLIGSQVDGDIPQHRQKGDEEFAMVRAYRDGDEMRHIHWRMSARHDQWIVKEFDSTKMPSMAVILNTDPACVLSGQFDPREHMLEVVASLAEKCAQEGYGLLVVLDATHLYQVKPFQRDLQPLLYRLAVWNAEPEFDAQVVLPKLQDCPLIISFSHTAERAAQSLSLMSHQHQIDIRFESASYPVQEESVGVRKSQRGRTSQLLLCSSSPLWELF